NISDFFQVVANACGIRGTSHTKDSFIAALQDTLGSDGASGRRVLLIIDEAQNLSHELLQEIRDLPVIATARGHALSILLVGQTDWSRTWPEDRHAALRQRITVKCTLDPLTPHEVGEYIGHCLKTVGASENIFSADAVREIALLSRGTPALINTMCDRALLPGFARRVRTIDREIIEAGGATLGPPSPVRPRGVRQADAPRTTGRRILGARARKQFSGQAAGGRSTTSRV